MAIDPNIVELINADIDGEISPADKDTLKAMMAESPEAQAMHAELSGLSSSLGDLPDLDAPPYLIHTIMAKIPKPESQDRRGDFLRGLFAAPALRYAAMFAAGAILTLSLVNSDQLSDRAFTEVTGLVGTISSEVPVTGCSMSRPSTLPPRLLKPSGTTVKRSKVRSRVEGSRSSA